MSKRGGPGSREVSPSPQRRTQFKMLTQVKGTPARAPTPTARPWHIEAQRTGQRGRRRRPGRGSLNAAGLWPRPPQTEAGTGPLPNRPAAQEVRAAGRAFQPPAKDERAGPPLWGGPASGLSSSPSPRVFLSPARRAGVFPHSIGGRAMPSVGCSSPYVLRCVVFHDGVNRVVSRPARIAVTNSCPRGEEIMARRKRSPPADFRADEPPRDAPNSGACRKEGRWFLPSATIKPWGGPQGQRLRNAGAQLNY